MPLSEQQAAGIFADIPKTGPTLTPEDAAGIFADVPKSEPTLTPEDAASIFADIGPAPEPSGPPSGMSRAFGALTGVRNWLAGVGKSGKASKHFTFGGLAESAANPFRNAYALLLGKDPSEIDVNIGGFEATKFADDQIAEGQLAQKQAAQLGPESGPSKWLYDLTNAGIQMAPAIATSLATRSPNASLAVMGTQVYGDAYGRAKAEGKSQEQAKADALIALVTEIGPEKAFAFFDNLVFGKGFKNLLMQAVKEAPSEATTSLLQIGDEMLRQGKDVSPSEAFGRVLYEASLGAGLGATTALPTLLGKQEAPPPQPGTPTAEELAVDYALSREYDRNFAPRQTGTPLEQPAAEPPPEAPEPPATEAAQAPPEAAAASFPPELQATVQHLQQAGLEAVDPLALDIDAATFQYKSGGDEQGVIDTLKSVKQWDDNKAGTIMVYEYADGRRVVADGHQRVGLARRLRPEGGVRIMAKVLREADGYTPADARRIAAETNIAQGTGTAVDAAKVLREISPEGRQEVLDKMPVGSAIVRDAMGLTKLGETAFMNVVNEQVSPTFGALVGERFADPAEQEAAMQLIIRHSPTSADQVRAMLEDMAAAGFQKSEQGGLFGDEQLESLIGERSRVLAGALSSARKDRALFAKLVGSAGQIAQAGNVLATGTNEQILQQTEQVLTALLKSINTTPELNGVLNELSAKVKAGELSVRAAAKQFLEGARTYLESSSGAGAQRSGNEGAAPAEPAPAEGQLIPGPTPGETNAAAQQKKDEARNGLGSDLVPPEEGGGELFAGNEPGQRPEQTRIDEPEPAPKKPKAKKKAKKKPEQELEQPATRKGSPEFNRLSFTNRPTQFHNIWSENGIDPDTAANWTLDRQVATAKRLLMDKYGFGKIEIDPKMPKIEARDQLADAYRNLSFMSHVLGLPANAIGLNGTLSMVLLKRAGYLGALIDGNIIALPGRSNSFAHEWGHALDYFLLNRIAPGEYAGLSGRVRADGIEPPPRSIEEAFVSLMDNLFFEQSELAAQLMMWEQKLQTGTDRQKAEAQQKIDEIRQGRTKARKPRSRYYRSSKEFGDPSYWNKPTEMLARAFEAYVANRVERVGGSNEFISKGDANYLDNAETRLAKTFPKLEERLRIFAAFDRLFEMIGAEDAFRGAPENLPGPGELLDIRRFRIAKEESSLVPEAKALFKIHKSLANAIRDFIRREKARPKHPEGWLRRFDSLRTMLFDTIRSRARLLEKMYPRSAAMRAMFNEVLLAPGEDRAVKKTYTESMRERYLSFMAVYNNILKNQGLDRMTDAQNAMLRELLLGNTVANAPANMTKAAAAIRRLLEKAYYDFKQAGMNIGVVSNKGYLTRTYADAKILADKDGFIRDAARLFRDHQFPHELGLDGVSRADYAETIIENIAAAAHFMNQVRHTARGNTNVANALARLRNKLNKIRGKITDKAEQQKASMEAYREFIDGVYEDVAANFGERKANSWYHAISTPNVEQYFSTIRQPGAPITKGRTLVGAADDVMKDWLETDVSVIMDRYARSSARKISFVERFGPAGEKLVAYQNQMAREGVHRDHIEEASALVETVVGRVRQNFPRRGQAFYDWGHTLGYMALLNLATFSSLAEAAAYGIRSGRVRDSFGPIVMLFRALTRSKKSRQLRELAHAMNVIGGRATESVLQNMMGGDYSFSPRARGTLNRFFEVTLLQQLTESQRAYGVGVADTFLRRLATDWIGNNNRAEAEAQLRELGIDNFEEFSTWLLQDDHYPTPDELYERDGYPTPRGDQYMLAVNRFIDQSIQNPDISLRPELASSPMGRLMYGIMAFSYAFYENLVKRELKIIKRKGMSEGAKHLIERTMPAFLLLGAQQVLVSTLRELIFHADKYEDMDDEEAAKELLLIGINRAFGYGGLDPFIQYALGLKYQRSLAETAVGAVPGYFMSNADQMFAFFSEQNSEETSTAEYRAGEAIYSMLMAPAMSFGLSMLGSLPGGKLIATPATYFVRSGREEFASLFGNKPDRRDAVDEELADLRNEHDKKLDEISQRIREKPRDQWNAELEKLREEFPEILEGARFDRYTNSAQNILKGRQGKVKVNKSRVQFKGLPDEYKPSKAEKAYGAAVKFLVRADDPTYGDLFAEIPAGLSPTLDKARDRRKPTAEASGSFIADVREELEDGRREEKRAEIKRIRAREGS